MTPLVVDVIREAPALERLGPEWQALLARSSSDRLFSTFEWLHTWWQHLGAGRRLCVRTVRRGGELVAIAPFVFRAATTTAHPAFGCIELLGAGDVGSDYGDLVVARDCEAECLEALAEHLASEHHVFAFRRLRDESCLLATLCRRLGQQRFTLEARPDELSPYVRFESRSFEGYLATLSHGHRHAYRRYRRVLARKHEVAFDTVRSEAERGPALASFLALHAARWQARGDAGAFARPELLAFHEAMSALALRRGWLRLQLLRLDGRAVAAVYGFRYGDVFYYYQTGFDPAFAADSVGLVACGLSIENAMAEGAAEFDFLHGTEDYKRRWAPAARRLVRLELYPPGPLGWAYRGVAHAERSGRTLARRALDALDRARERRRGATLEGEAGAP